MLSENDKKWLEGRKNLCLRCEFGPGGKFPNGVCWRGQYSGWDKLECDMFHAPRTGLTMPDLKEAAMFEAACAKRAECGVFFDWFAVFGVKTTPCDVCRKSGLDKPHPDDPEKCQRENHDCRQMWTRILTEMEMECAK